MASRVIVVQTPVRKKGQQCYFQVNIPRDASAIIGVEASITGLQGLIPSEIVGRQLCGQIRIQAENVANMCYSTSVSLGVSKIDKYMPGFNPVYTAWQQQLHISVRGNIPDPIVIPKSHMLYCCYSDVFGKTLNRDLTYIVGLYLWIEIPEQ